MRILWIGCVWPEPNSSAAGSRTMALLEVCQTAGYEVRFVSPCQENSYQTALEDKGIATARLQPNEPAFDTFIIEYQPQIVCFDRFMMEEQFSWRVRQHCPDAIRILDTVDLHSLRRARCLAVKRGEKGSPAVSEDTLREVAAIYRSDLSLIISDFEVELLTGTFGLPRELLEVVRFLYGAPSLGPRWEDRTNLVFIGNALHEPNLDAVRLLKRELWREIRAALSARGFPGVELHIYGAYPTAEMLQFDNVREGFRVNGVAGDVFKTLQRYRCNLAPLRAGAGLKGKVSDGWMVGTPCVGTSIAAEGMQIDGLFGGVIEDDLALYPSRVAELYGERDAWIRSQQAGHRILERLFSYEANAKTFLERLTVLSREFQALRERNIVGSILWYQAHRSTEYFSRWIECKNRTTPGTV